MGLITSIGNDRSSVVESLLDETRNRKPAHASGGRISQSSRYSKEFRVIIGSKIGSIHPNTMSPGQLFAVSHLMFFGAWCALKQAIKDANLSEKKLDPDSGLYTSSGGSMRSIHKHFEKMDRRGVMACNPLAIVASIAGTLTFNLVAALGVRGSSTGLVSACASSGHALGTALDEIRLGRQKRMLVVGAEDCNFESIVPFCGMRALSLETDPNQAFCPFDVKRNGFVAPGAHCLVLETQSEAERRGVAPYARFLGWGQASDGHNVAISHPEGRGLRDAMNKALQDAKVRAEHIDYVNAHAPSTSIGDASEMKALKSVFPVPQSVKISSTKALTGHGLSLQVL